MHIVNVSNPLQKMPDSQKTGDPINLFCQYYIDKSNTRQQEIIYCLQKNVENIHIDKIYLLNERIFTFSELGVSNKTNKIIQFQISKRLTYQDVFQYISANNINGYNVIVNSDIFLDHTIERLKYSDIHLSKKMLALLRYEYNIINIRQSKLFGPRFDSQDTWIIHSAQNIPVDQQKVFDFEFGKPGCDNKIIYLMNILGYEVINDPNTVKTYHYHTSQVRNYTNKNIIPNPYGLLMPANIHYSMSKPKMADCLLSYYKNRDVTFGDNDILRNYITDCFQKNKRFVIPKIGGIENNFACIGTRPLQKEYVEKTCPIMKSRAGIKMTTVASVAKYSQLYMQAFDNCELYFSWECYGNYITHIASSYQYMKKRYDKKRVWTMTNDIFHYIFASPWTLALKGKKILIISALEKSIQEKIQIRDKIYGIDLFPNCEFVTACPPQTYADDSSNEFDVELARFVDTLKSLEYDVALVSCGGYENLVCDAIYQHGKSAICVGDVLQMYFGILGNWWLSERPDIVKLFVNDYWTSPTKS